MVAMRVRNHATEQPPTLYWSTTAGVTLNSKYPGHPNGGENSNATKAPEEHGLHVIVASEPSTYKGEEWSLVEKNHLLRIGEGGVRSQPFNIAKDFISTINAV